VKLDRDMPASLARADSPHMTTIDLMMPRKNGWDALRELQADPLLRYPGAGGEREPHAVVRALDYLDKPVTREGLARVVGRNPLSLAS
jgi:CheY-like chemotaxis protein